MLNNILQYLDATARRVPDKTAFSDGRVALSFRELDGASRRIGTALYGRGAFTRRWTRQCPRHAWNRFCTHSPRVC